MSSNIQLVRWFPLVYLGLRLKRSWKCICWFQFRVIELGYQPILSDARFVLLIGCHSPGPWLWINPRLFRHLLSRGCTQLLAESTSFSSKFSLTSFSSPSVSSLQTNKQICFDESPLKWLIFLIICSNYLSKTIELHWFQQPQTLWGNSSFFPRSHSVAHQKCFWTWSDWSRNNRPSRDRVPSQVLFSSCGSLECWITTLECLLSFNLCLLL